MGCRAILEHHCRVVAALMLTLGANGPLHIIPTHKFGDNCLSSKNKSTCNKTIFYLSKELILLCKGIYGMDPLHGRRQVT